MKKSTYTKYARSTITLKPEELRKAIKRLGRDKVKEIYKKLAQEAYEKEREARRIME